MANKAWATDLGNGYLRALVVEDNPGDALLIRELLDVAFVGGVEVREAHTVAQAEVVLAEWAPDVVFQDLGLPGVEAIEGVDRVVAAAGEVPVIVLTGMTEETLGALAVHCGAQDYLRKGTSPEVLSRSVRYAIERRAARDALRAVEDRYRLIVEAAQEGVWILDDSGVTTFANGSLARMLGCEVDDIIGRPIARFLDPSVREAADAGFARRRAGHSERFETKVKTFDGREIDVEVRAAPIVGANGFEGATGLVTDITERKRREERLRFQASLLDAVGEAVFATDCLGQVTFWNRAAAHLLGWGEPEAIGQRLMTLVQPDLSETQIERAFLRIAGGQQWSEEMNIRHRSGESIAVRASLVPVYGEDETLAGAIGVAIDLSERLKYEESLAFQALHDDLTGLPNRRLFLEHVSNSLSRSGRSGVRTAVLFIDLDDFKALNDRHGHGVADEVLRAVSELLAASLREGDVVARLGGDEFVICCNDLTEPEEALAVADRVLAVLAAPFRVGEDTFTVGASVGVALSGPDSNADRLLRSADAAMYAAKQAGKRRIELFDDELHEELRRRKAAATDLLLALEAGEIQTYFQPEILLRNGELAAFEALARWTHPTRGPVPPDEFISIAEEGGLIGRLGETVLRASCEALASWIEAAPDRPVAVSVNVSARQLTDPNFPDVVRDAILTTDIPPGRLCLEITESALAAHDIALSAVVRLKEIGVKIAIDDFGTGYSSLSRLHCFPLDFMKIDRSFVRGMTERAEDAAIVSAVVDLAGSLGLATIAEGIETQEQLDTLAALGCEAGQGWLWAPAMPGEEAMALLLSEASLVRVSTVDTALPGVAVALEGADAAADRSLAVLAHELRQPLTVISGSAELLAESTDPQVIAWSAATVVRSTRRALAVLGMVSDSAALERGGILTLHPTDVRVADIVAQALMATGDRLKNELSLDVGEIAVRGDRDRLIAVLSNLLVNCAKHAPGSRVEVTAKRSDGSVTISVRDHGPGVPLENVGTIFKRFGRGATAASGSGLGLYVSRGIARAHGGHLRYRPAAGGGSDFFLELPLREATTAPPQSDHTHGVHFYRDFAHVAPVISGALTEAAAAGHAVLVVATPEHLESIEAGLTNSEILDSDRYVALGAGSTLAAIAPGGELDSEAFTAHITPLVADLTTTFGGVAVYGEMVDVLWRAGRSASAHRLEEAWNALAVETPFSLICAYGSQHFTTAAEMGTLAALHSHMQTH